MPAHAAYATTPTQQTWRPRHPEHWLRDDSLSCLSVSSISTYVCILSTSRGRLAQYPNSRLYWAQCAFVLVARIVPYVLGRLQGGCQADASTPIDCPPPRGISCARLVQPAPFSPESLAMQVVRRQRPWVGHHWQQSPGRGPSIVALPLQVQVVQCKEQLEWSCQAALQWPP